MSSPPPPPPPPLEPVDPVVDQPSPEVPPPNPPPVPQNVNQSELLTPFIISCWTKRKVETSISFFDKVRHLIDDSV